MVQTWPLADVQGNPLDSGQSKRGPQIQWHRSGVLCVMASNGVMKLIMSHGWPMGLFVSR